VGLFAQFGPIRRWEGGGRENLGALSPTRHRRQFCFLISVVGASHAALGALSQPIHSLHASARTHATPHERNHLSTSPRLRTQLYSGIEIVHLLVVDEHMWRDSQRFPTFVVLSLPIPMYVVARSR